MYVEDISRKLKRYNAALLLDYVTPETNIKLSNMISRIDRTTVSRSENSSDIDGETERIQYLTYSESFSEIMINQLRISQNIWNLNIDFGISYSYSKKDEPEELGFGGAVFADAGNLYDSDFAPTDDQDIIRSSVGASLLWDSPVGPLRADFAWVITKADFDKEELFRFGASTKF